jgi:hypothetical protein
MCSEEGMGLTKENPRYNVVSIRVSDDEKRSLDQIAKMANKSISEIMREAMYLFGVQQSQLPTCHGSIHLNA